jgi:hypothetical protein
MPWGERDEERRFHADVLLGLAVIRGELHRIAVLLSPRQATTAVLSINQQGSTTMATQAFATFTDASGAPIAPPAGDGSGLVVTFASDNPAVTIGAATGEGDLAAATITGTAAFNLSAAVANTSGAELFDDDGVTPFVQPAPIAVAASTPVDQAVTAVLSAQ